jgi:hypothetical protein
VICLMLWKAYDMARWKVAPAFLRPKGSFRYAKVPHGQMKVVLC